MIERLGKYWYRENLHMRQFDRWFRIYITIIHIRTLRSRHSFIHSLFLLHIHFLTLTFLLLAITFCLPLSPSLSFSIKYALEILTCPHTQGLLLDGGRTRSKSQAHILVHGIILLTLPVKGRK